MTEPHTTNYISLALNDAALNIDDTDIVDACYGHQDFTVEAWFRYTFVESLYDGSEAVDDVENSNDDSQVAIFLKRNSSWALGTLTDGRLVAIRYYLDSQGRKEEQCMVSEVVLSEEWNHVTFTVDKNGKTALYSHEMLVSSKEPPENWH